MHIQSSLNMNPLPCRCSKDPRVIDRSFIDHFEGTEVALEVGFADVTEVC